MVADTRVQLARAYDGAGRPEQAEAQFRAAIEFYRARGDSMRSSLANALALRGLDLLKRGEAARAEVVLRECVRLREQVAPRAWPRYDSMSLLGECLLLQGKDAEAAPLLLEGYRGLNDRAAKINGQSRAPILEAGRRVVQLYERRGEAAEAARWRSRLGIAAPPELPEDVFARP